MAGIYIHIPFCRQACHYCDFHFSTSMERKDEMVLALSRELELRKSEFKSEVVETIYFGGGTPSVLSTSQIKFLIDAVYKNYIVTENPEITLEANPDDLTNDVIFALAESPINRLSIGVQSFFDEELLMMNRAHDASQALESLKNARRKFDNISIDLIYGIPGMDDAKWQMNIDIALGLEIPHISAYALTVEPRTALHKLVKTGKIEQPSESQAQNQFSILVEKLDQAGFVHYELSNFGKQGYFSRNNTAYWLGVKYIGIGPSAHSYNAISRSWNISNNIKYLQAISKSELPSELEVLTADDRYNEYVMTGLRTIWGISLDVIKREFGRDKVDYLLKSAEKYFQNGLLSVNENVIKTTSRGKFLTDGIASDLFLVN
ncbi:MAG: radical SAM family heme chaperone HemW [Flavobacterium sp.]|nr:radical SAM family heme chaperone HemW [Flavobacterium sp.]